MSRPKVPDDKRQRTAQACENCKRRKQKCDGLKPCLKCSEKSVPCVYRGTGNGTDNDSSSDISEPCLKRRCGPPAEKAALDAATPTVQLPLWKSEDAHPVFDVDRPFLDRNSSPAMPSYDAVDDADDDPEPYIEGDAAQQPHSKNGPASVADTALYSTTRMLRDQTGRLLYIGESSTLSFLQLVRLIVESTSGHSPFTTDPGKEKIVENLITLPPGVQPPCMLADRSTAEVLVSAYFVHTSGLIDAFDRSEFMKSIDACYSSPLSVSNQFLCLLYLTFAIGLVMAAPEPGSTDDIVVRRLRNQPFDQAELFFRSARCLGDPLSGFEDADYWSVQALLLMSVYTQFATKRNASHAYHGMAVRSAIALGLHREETMSSLKGCELKERNCLWKSLYVFDRFLAASLGRPPVISDSDCWGEAVGRGLPSMPKSLARSAPADSPASDSNAHIEALNVSVQSSRIIGSILRKFYAKRKVSHRVAQEIANKCRLLKPELDRNLRWQQAVPGKTAPGGRVSHGHGISILHANLVYNHCLILLTRPFFLLLIQADRRGVSHVSRSLRTRTEKFSEVCVAAAFHSIAMIQTAHYGEYLSQRNVVAMYFLLTSALVVMTNYFTGLFESPDTATTISQAISLMEYFAGADPQGKRLLYILRAFEDVLRKLHHPAAPRVFRLSLSAAFVHGQADPADLFNSAPHASQKGCSDVVPKGNFFPSTMLPPTPTDRIGLSATPPDQIPYGSPGNERNNGNVNGNGQSLQIPQPLPSSTAISPAASNKSMTGRDLNMMKNMREEVLLSPAPALSLPPQSHTSSPMPGQNATPVMNLSHAVSQQQQRHQQQRQLFFDYNHVQQHSFSADLESLDSFGDAADSFDFDCLWNWAQRSQNYNGGSPSVATQLVGGSGGLSNIGLGIECNHGGDTPANGEAYDGGSTAYSLHSLHVTNEADMLNGSRENIAPTTSGGLGPNILSANWF